MKSVIDREKSVTAVVTASQRWAPSTAAALADLLRPELADGETLPDLELLQRLFGRALARRWERLQASDQAHLSARARLRLLLAERGAALRALYRRVADLRTLMRGVFGAEQARRLLGLAGKTSRDPLVLLRQAARALARLLDAPLPAAGFEPTGHDRTRWASPVEAAARDLEASRAAASLAGKRLEAAKAERRRALEDFNAVFVEVAAWLAGTYRAAGRADRAAAVRPCRRRPGLLLGDGRRRAAPARKEPASLSGRQTDQQRGAPRLPVADAGDPDAGRAADRAQGRGLRLVAGA